MSDAEWFLFVFFFFFFFWFLLSVFSFSFSFLFISSLIDVTAYRPTSAVTQRSSSQRRRRRDAHLGGRARYLPKWRPLGVNQKKNWMIWSHYLFFFVSFFFGRSGRRRLANASGAERRRLHVQFHQRRSVIFYLSIIKNLQPIKAVLGFPFWNVKKNDLSAAAINEFVVDFIWLWLNFEGRLFSLFFFFCSFGRLAFTGFYRVWWLFKVTPKPKYWNRFDGNSTVILVIITM